MADGGVATLRIRAADMGELTAAQRGIHLAEGALHPALASGMAAEGGELKLPAAGQILECIQEFPEKIPICLLPCLEYFAAL